MLLVGATSLLVLLVGATSLIVLLGGATSLIWNYPSLRVEPIVHSFERAGIVIFFLPTLKFLFHFQHAVVTAVSSSDDNWVVIH